MRYPEHSDFCEFLAELGALKETHNPCITADRCVAKEDQEKDTDDGVH